MEVKDTRHLDAGEPAKRVDSNVLHDTTDLVTAEESAGLVNVALNEDTEFVNRSKARFRRRLQDRWACQTPGHNHCYANPDGAHVPLNVEAIEAWVSALHDGTATQFIPPKSIIPSASIQSDDTSINTTTSSRTIQYQRPFRGQGNLSLTYLRSMQVRLRNSVASSSNTAFSSSAASSGIPGIGYLSGKVVKWVGLQILEGFNAVEILRRQWVIHRLVQRMGGIPADQRAEWIVQREEKINRKVDDLLELSSDEYKASYRMRAIKNGSKIRILIVGSDIAFNAKSLATVSSMRVKTLPLFLCAEEAASAEPFVHQLRETLLQDAPVLTDDELLVQEIAFLLCHELAYGPPSKWRHHGYDTLWSLYQTPRGKQCLQDSAFRNSLIEDLAIRASKTSVQDIVEHAGAVAFCAAYADDVLTFRSHVLGPTGIPLLIENTKGLEAKTLGKLTSNICVVFMNLSLFQWCLPTLVQGDLCPILVKLLIASQSDNSGDLVIRTRICYTVIRVLRNLAVWTGDGRYAVQSATTEKLEQILPRFEGMVRRWRGDTTASDLRKWIEETWPVTGLPKAG